MEQHTLSINSCCSFSELSAFFVLTGSEFLPQGVLLSWTKKFKARGVQDTDVVSRLTKALKKHKVRSSPGPVEVSMALARFS